MRTATRLLTTTLLAPVALAVLATPSFADDEPFDCDHPLCDGGLFMGEPMDVPDLDLGIPTIPPVPPLPPQPEPPIEVVPIDPCLVLDCDPGDDLAPPVDDPQPEPPGDLAPPADEPDPEPTDDPAPTEDPSGEPSGEPSEDPSGAAPRTAQPGPVEPTTPASAPVVVPASSLELAASDASGDRVRIVLATSLLGAGLAGAVAAGWLWRRARD